MMAEDYGDLDSEKVVLSFRGRGADEEINCVDKSLKELIARRRSEHEKQPSVQADTTARWPDNEAAMEFTARVNQKAAETPPAASSHGHDEESDIEIKLVSPLNTYNVTPNFACSILREMVCSDYMTQMNTSRSEDAGKTPGACERAVRVISKRSKTVNLRSFFLLITYMYCMFQFKEKTPVTICW